MQLKIQRSQREGGFIATKVIFCLDARVDFTQQERQHLTRYKLHGQVIYNSEASARHLARADAQRDGSVRGSLKSLASVALAAMKLNISIASLERGQRVECKSLDELVGAEEAIMGACENLKAYLDRAATFDGREELYEFESGGPKLIAQSMVPSPALVLAPTSLPAPQAASPAAIPPPAAEQSAPIAEPAIVQPAPDPTPAQPGLWSSLDPKQKSMVALAVVMTLFLFLVWYRARS